MDSLTHIFLGGALAQAGFARRLGYSRAFLIGALAATFPDFDVLLHTGNEVTNQAIHRHFMHSLVLVPVLAVLSLLPFLMQKKSRALVVPLYGAALLACLSHTLLDTLTSYGTMIFWPFSFHRFSLDIIPVIDPLYTVPLIVGTLIALKRRSARPAAIALVLSTLYLGIAFVQHGRAVAVQRQLLVVRHVTAAGNPRVLPQVGATVSYRSIYMEGNRIHADAIRVPFFGGPSFKPGGAVSVVGIGDLRPPMTEGAGHDLAVFGDLADGFLARSPRDPLLLSDQRYTYSPEGFDPVWGIRLEATGVPVFQITPRYSYFGILLRDLFRPRDYQAVP